MRADRVVLDSNVLISAVISPLGKPFSCLAWVLDPATLIASWELIEEVETRRRAFVADVTLSAVLVFRH